MVARALLLAISERRVERLAAQEVDLDLEVLRQRWHEGLQQHVGPLAHEANVAQVLDEFVLVASCGAGAALGCP